MEPEFGIATDLLLVKFNGCYFEDSEIYSL